MSTYPARVFLISLVLAFAAPVAAQTDAEVKARVDRLLQGLEGTGQVETRVDNGVVSLDGKVLEAGKGASIEQAVSRLDGVLAVNNNIELDLTVGSRINPMRERLRELGNTTLALIPLLGVALVIVLLFWFLSRLIARGESLLKHVARSHPLRELIARTAGAVTFLVGLVLALDILGATAIVGGVLGAAGIVGIAVGFAFKDLIENYIASIMLSIRQPFKPNDHVVIDGMEGVVGRLTTRATLLVTLDGNSLRIPNAQVFKSVILNYSNTPERRFVFNVGVGNGEDLGAVQTLGIEALQQTEGVLEDPGPGCRIRELGDSNVVVEFQAWVDQARHHFSKVRSDAIARLKRTFDQQGVDVPEPIYQLKITEHTRGEQPDAARTVTATNPQLLDQSEAQSAAFVQRTAEETREDTERNLIDEEGAAEE